MNDVIRNVDSIKVHVTDINGIKRVICFDKLYGDSVTIERDLGLEKDNVVIKFQDEKSITIEEVEVIE